MQEKHHSLRTRLTALLLALVCVLSLFPTTAFAAGDTITLKEFGHSGVAYQSAALGRCTLHEMTFKNGNKDTTGFCGTKGGGMGSSLQGQTWGNKRSISDPTVEIMMAYYYAHSTGVFTDEAEALGVADVWSPGYRWYMNAWVQACIWRYQQGSMSDPVVACAEELMAVYNTLEGTHYTSIDQKQGESSFRDRTQFILDLGSQGSIRKVDADNPSKGLAGAVIKITGVDNSFVGTYTTAEGGWLTDVPWDSMPIGSYVAEEMTPPEGYTKSPDQNKVKQSFHWDGKSDVSLVFENDSKVKIQLIKLDDSNNPLPGAVFNILKDGQIIGTEATKADGSITVTDVTEGMYAFVEVSAPSPYAKLTEPVIAHVDQTAVNGGGTVTVTASDKKLPNLTILKRDAKTGDVIPDTHFEIKGIHPGLAGGASGHTLCDSGRP
ncbi:SpaA isopeptide-forming pilin-related protein, partial [uncultured Oscillibacter sp.]|uniref:MSCRAMM family protein n=1 Tax=uncultured Oscillibacter sp. TaxID=876091 RepID=UPI0025ECC491